MSMKLSRRLQSRTRRFRMLPALIWQSQHRSSAAARSKSLDRYDDTESAWTKDTQAEYGPKGATQWCEYSMEHD
jgi:hypothetical protein